MCLLGCFCPCVLFGQNATKVDRSNSIGRCCTYYCFIILLSKLCSSQWNTKKITDSSASCGRAGRFYRRMLPTMLRQLTRNERNTNTRLVCYHSESEYFFCLESLRSFDFSIIYEPHSIGVHSSALSHIRQSVHELESDTD
jgi:hypothetical protein